MPKRNLAKLIATYPFPRDNKGQVDAVQLANIDNIITRHAQTAKSPKELGVRVGTKSGAGARDLEFQYVTDRLAHNASKRVRRACKRAKVRVHLIVI